MTPTIRFRGLLGGFLAGLGALLLLQQMAIVYPTRIALVLGVVLGLVAGVLVPTLLRPLGRGRKARPAPVAVAPTTATAATAATTGGAAGWAAAAPTAPAWAPTHEVPPEGLAARDAPDPAAAETSTLEAGLEVEVAEVRGEWAHVRAENGWTTWVDNRRLVPIPPWTATHRVPASGLPARETADPAAPEACVLDPGLAVQVVDRQGDWAHVRCENRWTAWVDGRGLEPV